MVTGSFSGAPDGFRLRHSGSGLGQDAADARLPSSDHWQRVVNGNRHGDSFPSVTNVERIVRILPLMLQLNSRDATAIFIDVAQVIFER